ncbi:MAG TPA: maleylpyruvate isomerase N-terminal domain-containing protein, partial [Candidatus Limnocylindrales bacterium]
TRRTLAGAKAKFATDDATIDAAFRELLASVPIEAWTEPADGDWTLADHVAHLATWFHEGARALEVHRETGAWTEMPPEGLDAFNDRTVRAARGTPAAELRGGYQAGIDRLRDAVGAMTDAEWLDPEGFSWAYEDLHGHVRAHHAMIGPWAARIGWPPSERDARDRAG